MKTPADYLNTPVLYLTYPNGEVAESVPVVTYDDALRAIETALADAEEYKYLLTRALRRQSAAEHPILQVAETPIRVLRPEEETPAQAA